MKIVQEESLRCTSSGERDGYTFCLAGTMGEQARSMLGPEATMIWTVHAESHFEAMTKYYQFMNWGVYRSDFPADKDPYPASWVETQK